MKNKTLRNDLIVIVILFLIIEDCFSLNQENKVN